jgi:hypothetical protein
MTLKISAKMKGGHVQKAIPLQA